MSKKEEFWNYLIVKNPKLLEGPHFTAKGIKQFFDAVYKRANDDGFYAAAELHKVQQFGGSAIFEKIFGKR